MALDPEFIQSLLKADLNKQTPTAKLGPIPVQIGPLRRYDSSTQTMRCASRGCGCPSYSKVRGVPLCTIHAMDELNRIILTELEGISIDECNCKAGHFSRGRLHAEGCPIFNTYKDALPTSVKPAEGQRELL